MLAGCGEQTEPPAGTDTPTDTPTETLTDEPTDTPTDTPTETPTEEPTEDPTPTESGRAAEVIAEVEAHISKTEERYKDESEADEAFDEVPLSVEIFATRMLRPLNDNNVSEKLDEAESQPRTSERQVSRIDELRSQIAILRALPRPHNDLYSVWESVDFYVARLEADNRRQTESAARDIRNSYDDVNTQRLNELQAALENAKNPPRRYRRRVRSLSRSYNAYAVVRDVSLNQIEDGIDLLEDAERERSEGYPGRAESIAEDAIEEFDTALDQLSAFSESELSLDGQLDRLRAAIEVYRERAREFTEDNS
ncbi:hypothetical protein GJ631_00160 [Natronomonas sp. CBA1123]|uniref:hypothetical protein n=1 Tax=Natronomonas sp. CBA1123 TaxID=2668070 RepID=UPI0012EA8377|nr:hypothetical protein [Natronomonas sp. CBA1123]MUV85036.1 hypothetical protein [Natronomonas sp. CBA1123]